MKTLEEIVKVAADAATLKEPFFAILDGVWEEVMLFVEENKIPVYLERDGGKTIFVYSHWSVFPPTEKEIQVMGLKLVGTMATFTVGGFKIGPY